MRPAKPTDWKTYPLPSKKITIRLDRTFSPQEMKRLSEGLVPRQMEDKWFIYWKDDTLYFHRSWTGCQSASKFDPPSASKNDPPLHL
jgi:8-oxo-dGTP diphosphatase